MTQEHVKQLSRVYSPVTWDVYEKLDQSLNPRGTDWLLEFAGQYLNPGGTVLDAGCRDAAHLIALVRDHDAIGFGMDPVPLHIERGQEAVDAAGLQDRITLAVGGMEDAATLAAVDGEKPSFDLVWCRDVVPQINDLPGAITGVAQVLKSSGRMIVFTTLATDLLMPQEIKMLCQHLGNVIPNLQEEHVEASFKAAGLEIEQKIVIGTEFREFAEERTQPVSRALLRLARLRRSRDEIVAGHGEDVYLHIEANLHWEVYQFLGKIMPIVYVLRSKE